MLSHSILIHGLQVDHFQWKRRSEQHEPPTEDKVIQVDVGDQPNPKLISIGESLSAKEK